MSDSEDPIDVGEEVVDDLFGDEEVVDALSEVNEPSDRELASDRDDDENEGHGARSDNDEPTEFREKLVSAVPLYRHRIPKSKDGSLHSLKVPDFLKLNPIEYKADTWEPSKWDLENAAAENPKPSVLFRRNPETGQIQSNANIYRWSDGSVTLGIGEDHFEMQTKSLAPPRDRPYQEVQDAHYYAAAAHLTTNSLLIIGHFTEQYSVKPNKQVQDHALEKLKAELAGLKKDRGSDMIIVTTEDPELQKKQAELAEKERAKLQRKRESAAARVDGAGGRYKGGALSIGDLEGGRRAAGPGGRKRGAPGSKKKHRRPEYDSDDDLPSGARQNDNYDMDDGFLVDSDEESAGEEDDEDEEEILDDDDDDEEAPRSKRQKTADRVEEDADAEADLDDDAPAHAESSSRRRRRVIDDDED
ncbi:Leo1-like protein-domain-containing protein [Lasiosphaeris hirsuta]|uniref:Leo1-like protein-domain-containing protein n=1 Tax=Lasiosphaeris hirsuta TaxID=260670 RepID=A0AA40ED91_9PEZI|nr:Leo1-like protein-domain-containing protein [Lasiosphaeris hirsuta]